MKSKKGGKVLGVGVDTCVYEPVVQCADKPTPTGDYVSRLTRRKNRKWYNLETLDKSEAEKQDVIRKLVQDKTHINLAQDKCTPNLTDEDTEGDEFCDIRELNTPGVKSNFDNLITPKQGKDVVNRDNELSKSKEETRAQLPSIVKTAFMLNQLGIVHGDLHFENIAWMGDKLVIHDWGRSAVNFDDFVRDWVEPTLERFDVLKKIPHTKYTANFCKILELHSKIEGTSLLISRQPLEALRLVWDTCAILGSLVQLGFVSKEDAGKIVNSLDAKLSSLRRGTNEKLNRDEFLSFVQTEVVDNIIGLLQKSGGRKTRSKRKMSTRTRRR